MNAFSPGDFGELSSLLQALGLSNAEGEFNADWITGPEDYLASILADDDQRAALLDFVATVREGEIETDSDGRQWIELFSEQVQAGLDVAFFVVVDDQPAGQVNLFLGIRMITGGALADSTSSLMFPLFRAAKTNGPAPADAFLAGQEGGHIALSSEITVGPPPQPGEAGLARVGVRIALPTAAGDGAPDVALSLGGLQLPGEQAPRDLVLSLTDPDALQDTATELILSLLEAQLRGGGGDEVRALATALGLGGAPEIPAFPASDLLDRGLDAVADWIADVLGNAPSRARWLEALADILGSGAAADQTGIDLPLGGGTVRIGFMAEPGATARPKVTVSLAFGLTSGTAEARFAADILQLDLGTADAIAVPALEASLRFDLSGLAMPDVSIERLILGLTLNEDRRPDVVVAVENAVISQTTHPRLDLTNPDALAAAAAQAVTDILTELLSNLGPGAELIGVALGWRAPTGAGAGFPTLDPITFLGDPIARLRDHWLTILEDHTSDVTAVLQSLRTLLTGAADVTGTGTEADPWRLSIRPGIHVAIWRTDTGALALGLGWMTRVDDLGDRCTVLEMRGRLALVSINLSSGATAFVPSIDIAATGRPRGGGRMQTGAGGLSAQVDHLGFVASWAAQPGLSFRFDAPNPTISIEGIEIPLDLPDLTSDIDVDLITPRQWDGIERLLGLLAERSGNAFLLAIIDCLGWRRERRVFGEPDPNRLQLAALVSEPADALRDWLGKLLSDPVSRIAPRLEVFAATLETPSGRVSGAGTLGDPWRIELPGIENGPGLAAWRMPERSEPAPDRFDSLPLRRWRPGNTGLEAGALALALQSELPAALNGLGTAEFQVGLDALTTAWTLGDGMVRPPASAPTGTVLHIIENADADSLISLADAEPYLGAAPPVLFVVRTLSENAPPPADTTAARRIDLRISDREPTAFPQVPADASGTWTILLAPRPDTPEGGAAGQAARLAHALAPASSIADAAVLADRAAGHAVWLALNGMAAGPDRLLIAGLAGTSIDPLTSEASEALSRLDELLPPIDPTEPDDPDLALGRQLIGQRRNGRPLSELAPPAGWTGSVRAGLEIHLLHGVIQRDVIQSAMTAVTAAGLSAYAVGRAARSSAKRIEAAGLGVYLPVGEAPANGTIGFEGRAMAELLSTGLDRDGLSVPQITARLASKVVVSGRITRGNGWLIGGPDSDDAVAPLALRSIEVSACVGTGGTSEPETDGIELVFHGVRILGESHARLAITPDSLSDSGLASAAPTAPGIRELLAEIVAEASITPAAGMAELLDLLRATGILGADDAFDPLSLSHWIDDPTAQLQVALGDPSLGADLLALVQSFVAGTGSGISFDSAQNRLNVSLGGSADDLIFGQWSLEASLGASGLLSGALEFGVPDGLGLQVGFAPFSAQITLPGGLPDIPASMPLWPDPNFVTHLRAVPPILSALALSRLLEGLRSFDPAVTPIVDAGLAAFGLNTEPVRVPPILFTNPGVWLSQADVLGGPGGGVRAARVIAVMDALRPLIGVGGGSGIWTLSQGVDLVARDAGGLVLEFQIDPSAFLPDGDIAFGGAFGLRFPTSGGQTRPEVSFFAGLPGGTPGTRAVHLSVSGDVVRLLLRPDTGADIEIYPGPPDLTSLLTTALVAALPQALDAIVDTGTDVGDVVADIGDALALRVAGSFDAGELADWAADPQGSLAARWPTLLSSGLAQLGPVLPTGVSVAGTASGLRVTVANAGTPGSSVSVELFTAPLAVEFAADLTAIPFVEDIDVLVRVDTGGLARLNTTIGPAAIPVADGFVLRPIVEMDVGSSVATPEISTGLSFDPAANQVLRLTYDFQTQQFRLGVGADTPAEIAAALMHLAVELVGGFVLGLEEVDALLDLPVGSSDVRGILGGVILTPGGALDADFFRVLPGDGEDIEALLLTKLDRLLTLIENIADAGPSVRVGGEVDIGIARVGNSIGLSLGIANRFEIVGGDIAIWLENDSRWINGDVDPGLQIGLLSTSGGLDFAPTLAVNGIGIRIGRSNAPLVKSPIALGSIAIHAFARVETGEVLGGAQVELAEVGAAVGGGSGDNAVASGLLSETNDGDAALAPAFSPALSVQTLSGGGFRFGFRAGEGSGPWWLPIRKGFGPLYVDQIGLGAQSDETEGLQSISLLFDGSVTIAGLAASVDDLELIYRTDRGGLLDSASWGVDLAGLGISADLSGISLAGGLRKFGETPDIEYVGMIAARFAVYGLSIYGGYASTSDDQGRYTAFFAVGSFLGPIGGAPAFFLTGIGGGFGINRDLVPPTDLGDFGDFVLIQALDPAADLPTDVIAYLEEVRNTFPAIRGKFWFAAGISFTSFALVDGIAVVAVEFGNGFELSIFGLARMALPRPQFALVSIELGLLARFSTEEGVIWIQAQLTDNSWLLHPSARLTGGFAYVSWFKGPNRGQFVLTLGGYHPNFDAEGYPVVPRLGYNWSVSSNIVIKAENYFALTSEAIMGGGLFEASAKFGPVFASLGWGGNAIVYFDPFRYEADAYARISAGIRIKTWFGTIKLSFTLSAEIQVAGPEFHGKARIKIGPIDVTVKFGKQGDPPIQYISWVDFSAKYLELASGNLAEALSGIAGRGALPPASNDGEPPGTADGSEANPFDVMSEFELSLTSTIPLTRIIRPGRAPIERDPTSTLGVAPVNLIVSEITLSLQLRRLDRPNDERLDDLDKIKMTTRNTGAFPVGVWGPPQGLDDKKVPKGKVIGATEGVDLRFVPEFFNRRPDASTGGVAFNQVESDLRKPLPLRDVGQFFVAVAILATEHRTLLSSINDLQMAQLSAEFQQDQRLRVGATGARAFDRSRRTPMRVGLLTERIVSDAAPGAKREVLRTPPERRPIRFGTPRLRGQLALPNVSLGEAGGALAARVTRVPADRARRAKRVRPPVLDEVLAARQDRAPALLLRAASADAQLGRTVVAEQRVPLTLAAGVQASSSATRASGPTRDRLAATALMAGAKPPRGAQTDNVKPTGLAPGEIAVFDLPGAARSPRFETSGVVALNGPARIVAIGLDGRVLSDSAGDARRVKLPKGTAAYAVVAGDDGAAAPEFAGWTESESVAYFGRSLALCRGGFLYAEGASRVRGGRAGGTGWFRASHLTDQSALVETRFDRPATSVALLLEGEVVAEDLESLAISVRGAEVLDDKPILAPLDGKTLVVYALKPQDDAGFAVRVAGLVPGRLDGVIAAQLQPDRLVTRLLNESVSLSVGLLRGKGARLTFKWSPPADVTPRQDEYQEF